MFIVASMVLVHPIVTYRFLFVASYTPQLIGAIVAVTFSLTLLLMIQTVDHAQNASMLHGD